MARICRKITLASCNGQRLNAETGEFEDFCEVMVGVPDAARATNYFRRKHKDKTITINNVELDTHSYSMDTLVFIANSERID